MREITIACTSDIHLGSPRNPTQLIINNLNKHLVNDRFLAGIDLLFLAGDIFDQELSTYSQEYAQITAWVARLLRKCRRYNVTVRVLEGTRSHDRGQSIVFVTINEAMKKIDQAVDLKYIDDVHVELIEKFQLSVLYVPDNMNCGDTAITAQQAREKIAQAGLKQVDIAVMHGSFAHQLPVNVDQGPVHDADVYEQLVRQLIFIGHIHTPSVLGKIHAQGSFDRLAHNEEHPKGFLKAKLTQDSYELTFIENTDAAIYKTINVDGQSLTDTLLLLDESVKELKNGSKVRVEANKGHPILDNLELLRQRWPLIEWSSVTRGKEKKKTGPLIDHKLIYRPPALDSQTLHAALIQRLMTKNYPSELVTLSSQLLEQYTPIQT